MFCNIHSHSTKLHWTDAHLGWDTLPETTQLHIYVGGLPKQKDCMWLLGGKCMCAVSLRHSIWTVVCGWLTHKVWIFREGLIKDVYTDNS